MFNCKTKLPRYFTPWNEVFANSLVGILQHLLSGSNFNSFLMCYHYKHYYKEHPCTCVLGQKYKYLCRIVFLRWCCCIRLFTFKIFWVNFQVASRKFGRKRVTLVELNIESRKRRVCVCEFNKWEGQCF